MTTYTQWLRRPVTVLGVLTLMLATSACGAEGDSREVSSSAASGSGLPSEVADAGKLVVATGDYKVPTNYRNDDGELVGFNIDVAKALGDQLGIKLELAVVPFDAALAGIQAGRYDTALYNVSDSSERRQVLDFVDYAVSGSVVVTPKGERNGITGDPQSLCGRKVALTAGQYEFQVLKDEVSPKCADRSLPPIDLQTYKDDSTVQQSLLSGRSEAFVGGFTTTPYLVSQNADKFELVGKLPIGADPLGMPFAKGNPELLQAIKRAWEELLRSGQYERIAQKWSLTALMPEEITINGGESS